MIQWNPIVPKECHLDVVTKAGEKYCLLQELGLFGESTDSYVAYVPEIF